MAVNTYFGNKYARQSEQNLVEQLTVESIQINGMDVFYVPREVVNKDSIFNEDASPNFERSYIIEVYVKNVDAMGGEGDILGKFGLEVRDSITFVVARRRFLEEIGDPEGLIRPREGDLIFVPLLSEMFEIRFVEHESVFYQNGGLYVWEITADLMENSGERVDTGNELVDNELTNITDTGSLEELKDKDDMSQNFDFSEAELDLRDFTESDPFAEESEVPKRKP